MKGIVGTYDPAYPGPEWYVRAGWILVPTDTMVDAYFEGFTSTHQYVITYVQHNLSWNTYKNYQILKSDPEDWPKRFGVKIGGTTRGYLYLSTNSAWLPMHCCGRASGLGNDLRAKWNNALHRRPFCGDVWDAFLVDNPPWGWGNSYRFSADAGVVAG